MTAVKVGLAQINMTVGDLRANAAKVAETARWAENNHVDILLTPELTLTGYPAEDLLLRPEFISRQLQVLEQLCRDLARHRGLHVVVGYVHEQDGALYNAAAVLSGGRVIARYLKHELPDYGVFDEKRYFAAGGEPVVFAVNGVKFGLNICEDAWFAASPALAAENGAQVLLVLNASPYSVAKQAERLGQVGRNVHGLPTVYLNKVGGQDELVFDGASFVLDAQGVVVQRLPVFEEALGIVGFDDQGRPEPLYPVNSPAWPDMHAQVYQALTLALRDYLGKSGFSSVVLGLSGGIDSALVLAVAVDAIGAQNVRCVMMPSRYTADISQIDARRMADGLNVRYDEIGIAGLASAFELALSHQFAGLEPDTTEENIQARVRGTLLMALSNKFGSLVISTGNKSELATGYCTLYGDMVGGFALLKDVPKTLVYELSRWRNRQSPVIPERIIERPPSAELRPDQTDQDSLPPYDVLDAIIELYVEKNASIKAIEAAGFERDVVAQVVRLIRINEYKRRQGAIGPKITARAFGRDWRYPITNGFRE
ncbi:NAD+ synthase [Eoetvoesiella caeni]|uniref:Glutamine-dependent NAD(+) synthetase n=1 Tax=Eoetvoesiella caeni TaxID=645616 RepID=A0A366HLA5_9BURK|nr:NAD+ synthase [Eoetvoesiella caeni]MCI2807500.1 NAD+ synthase [Eoetvoesiella caeni]NYT53105.1 NAD+ synthase [Eoetvoesiella caeni]RBP43082.1 NAD+ synthase (glutamine-hydrolysing) [Eoetvoesiella caeni]